ncbi:MAG: hypothetical protein NTW13_05035 [Candidatus Omnitrophica bacterium]|nr:hypothetical protein [Candidatus Omnitrophota bacterium]
MKQKPGIILFGLTEIIIGLITLISLTLSPFLNKFTKPPSVFAFVLIAAFISLILGIGILRRSLSSYHILLFFATVIILSKLLIFAKVISLSGALETTIPSPIKDIASIFYHTLLIIYFSRPDIREYFGERRGFFKLPLFKR